MSDLKVFVTADYAAEDPERFERSVYLLRKQALNSMTKQQISCYVCSLSTTTIVYKVITPLHFLKGMETVSLRNVKSHVFCILVFVVEKKKLFFTSDCFINDFSDMTQFEQDSAQTSLL